MTRSPNVDPKLSKPPRWIEWMMCAALRPRDRETVSGDLLEEYREEILPARGRLAANLWYLRQALSLMNGAWIGIAVGLLLSGWIVIGSLVFLINESWYHPKVGEFLPAGRFPTALFDPLAFHTRAELIVVFLMLYLSPFLPGFLSRRRGGKVVDTMIAGALASTVIFSVTAVAGDVRMNIVLEMIRNRPEWHQALMALAGSRGVTAEANYHYAKYVPSRIVINTAFGAAAGTIGGLIGKIGLHQAPKLQNS